MPTTSLITSVITTAIELGIYNSDYRSQLPPALVLNGSPLSVAIKLLALNLGLWVTWALFIWPFFFNPLRHLPGPPKSSLLIGNAPAILSKPPGAEMLTWVETVPHDSMIYFRGWFNQGTLLLTGPKALSDCLQKNCYDWEKPEQLRKFLGRVQGDGLSVVEGNLHKFQRKALNPAFHMRSIKDLYPLFWAKAQVLVETLKSEFKIASPSVDAPLTGTVEMGEWASRVSMDIIGVAALGRDLKTLANPNHPIMTGFAALFDFNLEAVMYLLANLVLPQQLVAWSPFFKKSKNIMGPVVDELRSMGYDMVQDKKAEKTQQVDILSVLLRTESFSDTNLVDQLITILAAGHETTANALSWATYLLAIHPEIQRTLRSEIRAAIPSFSHELTAPDVDTLPLLSAVISESLRLFPGAPVLLRESVRPTFIQDQYIPVGTQVILCPWAVNRNPELWGEDAGKFVPERWIDRDGEKVKANNHGGAPSNYAFLTFLQGPRRCIGENFSRSELKCLLAALVGNFEIVMKDPQEKIVPTGVIGLKPEAGMHVTLKALDDWA